MELVPLRPAIGAEVRQVGIGDDLDDESFAGIKQAWCERGVLLFRDQQLDGPTLARFSRRFGELEPPPASERSTREDAGSDEAPEVWLISNVIEDGKPIGSLGSGEAEWHTDMSYLEEPPTASILFGHEVPPAGANTSFASMEAALDRLPAELRHAIEGKKARHSASYTAAGELRQGADAVVDVTTAPGVEHPIIRTHPETGRKSIYLGRRRNGYIVGLTQDASDKLLDELWNFTTGEEFIYEHVWRVGDLLVWDNRSVIHRRDAFDPASRRILMRAQVKGDRPR
jgi:taurine dioxygenase